MAGAACCSRSMPTTRRRPPPSIRREVMWAFKGAPHYLLDARLMQAWAIALDESGDTDRARYVAARLKEFRSDQSEAFFAPCDEAAKPDTKRPFQCEPPLQRVHLPRLQVIGAAVPVARLAAALLEHADLADHHAAIDRLAHVVDRQQRRPGRRSAPPSRRRCGRASRPCAVQRDARGAARSRNPPPTRVIGSGWQSGISSAVRFAAWIAAMRATPITSPFFAVPRRDQRERRRLHADHAARAPRRDGSRPCAETSTMWAWPCASKCVRTVMSSGETVWQRAWRIIAAGLVATAWPPRACDR